MSVLVPSWGRASPARPAFLAAYYEAAIGAIVFLIALFGATVMLGQSPGTAIFGPARGMPLIAWVVFMAAIVGIQLAVALAVWQGMAWLRAIGAFLAGVLAVFGGVWTLGMLIWTATSVADYLARGGDRGDLIGGWIFTPVILWLGFLNGRAASRAVAALRGG